MFSADLYGVTTKRLNEQVKRNEDRFTADFTFQLTSEEWESLNALNNEMNRSQFVTGSFGIVIAGTTPSGRM